MLLEQGTTLALGHSAPDSELHAIVQRISAAFEDHRAVPTDHRGFTLGGTPDEQLVRIGLAAPRLRNPRDPGFALTSVDQGGGRGGSVHIVCDSSYT